MPSDGEEKPDSLLLVQLDELRHRLRNHLQNMTSLISLQIRRARHPEAVQALEDLRVRFATLTSIYIDLDEASERAIALDEFIPDLVRRIGELYDPKSEHTILFAVDAIFLPHNRAAILGQVMVELVMNVYRHAFAERSHGTIGVELILGDDAHALLVISDDGPGLREPDASRVHLGFRIVTSLAGALGGTFERASRNGFVARLRFPLGEPGAGAV